MAPAVIFFSGKKTVFVIDGTIPQELYSKYFNIVISETERLNKLTEGMLTLNSLDSWDTLAMKDF